MTSTWILVADAARARLFEATGRSEPWQEVACFANPDGRAPGRHATTERAPRVNESMGSARHAIEPHTTLRDKSTDQFAHMLGDALQRGHDDHRYQHLVLVAPPRFLGALHGALDKQVAGCVSGEIQHDFTALRGDEIRSRLPPQLLA
ncbi:host attachment protein [Dyella ginsengisoli]|uniref:Host attachment protein n=1 Tax=Dyella ginsengisoli TaxID=363848 RepID=A0ABW8JV64_9GAMM